MMRNGIKFRVFSGNKEVLFTTQKEVLKDKEFERICINGLATSYTTTMGPTWTEDWFVLREIYCNALDEGDCTLVKETENVNPSEGFTRIYIQATKSLSYVVENWDAFFSEDRSPIFVANNVYTSYLTSAPKNSRQSVKVFPKTKGVLYRKGIKVYQNSKFLFDYDIEHVDINEDRTAKHGDAMTYAFASILADFPNEQYVVSVLISGQEDELSREYNSMQSTKPECTPSSKWVEFSQKNTLVLRERSGNYQSEILRSKKPVYYVPQYFAKQIKKCHPDFNILGMQRTLGDVAYSDVEVTPKMKYLLSEVSKSLSEMSYNIPYEVQIVSFDDEDILGQADLQSKTILVSDSVFNMGRRELALVLMEEAEHINSGCHDETRGFQNHLLTSWLTTMENSNGLFL
jgi:hypothetical protein